MPARKKPEGERVRRNKPKAIDRRLVGIHAPPPPEDLLVATKDWWEKFWGSELAKLVKPTDMPALERLTYLYDERERTRRAVRRGGRLTTGSTGQMVLNPLIKYLDQLDKEIRALEDRFGLTVRARMALGLKFEEGMQRLEDLIDGDTDAGAGASPNVIDIGEAGGDLATPARAVRRPRQRRR